MIPMFMKLPKSSSRSAVRTLGCCRTRPPRFFLMPTGTVPWILPSGFLSTLRMTGFQPLTNLIPGSSMPSTNRASSFPTRSWMSIFARPVRLSNHCRTPPKQGTESREGRRGTLGNHLSLAEDQGKGKPKEWKSRYLVNNGTERGALAGVRSATLARAV